MDIRLLGSDADYDKALREIEPYFLKELRLGTPEADRFDLLAVMIARYEDNHWKVEPAE